MLAKRPDAKEKFINFANGFKMCQWHSLSNHVELLISYNFKWSKTKMKFNCICVYFYIYIRWFYKLFNSCLTKNDLGQNIFKQSQNSIENTFTWWCRICLMSDPVGGAVSKHQGLLWAGSSPSWPWQLCPSAQAPTPNPEWSATHAGDCPLLIQSSVPQAAGTPTQTDCNTQPNSCVNVELKRD